MTRDCPDVREVCEPRCVDRLMAPAVTASADITVLTVTVASLAPLIQSMMAFNTIWLERQQLMLADLNNSQTLGMTALGGTLQKVMSDSAPDVKKKTKVTSVTQPQTLAVT
jgi:hypothetical protein